MYTRLLIFIQLIIGCAPTMPLDGNVCIDPSFSEQEREYVEIAIKSWYDASNGRINLTYSDNVEGSHCDAFMNYGILQQDWGGVCNRDHWEDPNIVIQMNSPKSVAVMAHELGHAMGAKHTDFAFDVMFDVTHPRHLPVPQITKADVKAVLGD